jgi:hypothetical protein
MEVWNFKYYKHKRERIKVSTKWNIDLLGSNNTNINLSQDDIQEAIIIMYKKLINFITIYLKGLY